MEISVEMYASVHGEKNSLGTSKCNGEVGGVSRVGQYYSNSGGSELQGNGQFLKHLELYWKKLTRTWKAQKWIGEYTILGNSNTVAIPSKNTELGTDLS